MTLENLNNNRVHQLPRVVLLVIVSVFLFAFLLSSFFTVRADSVAQVQTSIFMAPETVDFLKQKALLGSPGLAVGDTYSYIAQFTPVPNHSNNGLGGYLTFYVPGGSEVIGAAIVKPNVFGGYDAIAPSLPGPGPDGWGSRGRQSFSVAPWNTAFNALCGTYGQPVGQCNGGIAQLYADTGIFYSTDSRTALFVGPDTDNIIRHSVNGYKINPTANNQLLGILNYDEARTHNLWDASMTNAFGTGKLPTNEPKSSTPKAGSGAGATPFTAGSPVAGSDSGFKLDYTGLVGPWQRIFYNGSRV